MTSATEELRRLLDERGVEWTACDGEHVRETCWDYMGELTAAFAEFDNGTTTFACDTWCFTPEQAIVATLESERGTCHIVREKKTIRSMLHGEVEVTDERCSECNGFMDVGCGVYRNYCPNCGRKVAQ